MIRAYIDVSDIEREKGEQMARSIAEKVLRTSNREPVTIEVMSLPSLQEIAPESYNILVKNGDIETEKGLEGTIEVSDETVTAVLNLFHPALLKAVFRDENGKIIFARHEYEAMEFYVNEDAYAEIKVEMTDLETNNIRME
jgi:hypothetical protein